MNKYIKFIAFALMAVFSLAFVSCGDDDDDPDVDIKNGKVSVAYAGAITETYSVTQATFTHLYQRVVGTTKIDSSDGVTFDVTFSDDDGSYTYWQFQTQDEIKKGANLSIDGVFFGYDSARHTDDTEGDAKVKAVSSNKITLSFKNFRFERYISISSNKKQVITINGEITFTLDE